jgi:hypothetical protein
MRIYLYFVVFVFYSGVSFSQNEVFKVIELDEVTISAALENFKIEDFINRVKTDTTFYKAFLNLKYFPQKFNSSVVVYNKDDAEKASMTRKSIRRVESNLMWVEITEEKTKGKIKDKKGNFNYLTADMFDEVFFNTEKERVSNNIVKVNQELSRESKIEKHKSQLKKMMFNPGQEIGNVPLIGDKMAIFDDHMVPFYDYRISSEMYDNVDCYVFSVKAKPELNNKETVIKELTSYFEKETMNVMGREYHLEHSTPLFDFDIRMKIQNFILEGNLVPKLIEYAGYWDVPFKKPEVVAFNINCFDYIVK